MDSVVFRPIVDRVHGTVFLPAHARVAGGAVVIGDEGGGEPSWLAEALARAGIPALSVAYFDRPGLPPRLRDIPLEYFADAVGIVRSERKDAPVVLVGLSRGSEAAMLTAIHFPMGVAGVVVTVPGDVAVASAWKLGGQAVPAEPIPVERIRRPLLLISAGADDVRPSGEMARSLTARRQPGDHELLEYPEAGHALGYLVPDLPIGLRYRDVKDTPTTHDARVDAFRKAVTFILGTLGE